MSWKKKLLRSFKLYAITDIDRFDKKWLYKCEAALCGGADVLQLRSKTLTDLEIFRLGKELRKISLKLKKLFIINDRIDLAAVLEADGVHLGQDDLPIQAARTVVKRKDFIVGRSTHSLQQARLAARDGADYIGFGPLFATPTKPNYEPVGLEDVAAVHRAVKIPIVCIGGINESNVARVIEAGASRVAVVRSIFGRTNVKNATLSLKRKIQSCLASH